MYRSCCQAGVNVAYIHYDWLQFCCSVRRLQDLEGQVNGLAAKLSAAQEALATLPDLSEVPLPPIP